MTSDQHRANDMMTMMIWFSVGQHVDNIISGHCMLIHSSLRDFLLAASHLFELADLLYQVCLLIIELLIL